MKARISLDVARQLVLRAQGLDGSWKLPRGKAGALAVIEQLGYVQIDSISVIERAHHHVFWSRFGQYAPQMLHEMLAVDRSVFEYWTHAMSYVPMRDYRFSMPLIQRFVRGKRHLEWKKKNKKVMDEVLTRIRAEGPLGSADFKATGKRGSWWDWKPAKIALELLFDAGELMVCKRRNFQRIYDLTERVLPKEVDTREPDQDELGRFLVRRTLNMLGVMPENEARWGHKRAAFVKAALHELVDAGDVQAVEIAGLDETFYALTDALKQVPRPRKARMHILSPFDNLTIRRYWLKALFDFDYRLECYTPSAKRTYGYFCLPVLWGTEFVGRVDAKADRKAKVLIVRNFAFESTIQIDETLMEALRDKLYDFAAFNGCDDVLVEKTTPAKMKAPLKKILK